jgi:DNA-binding Lrp family transcriptional regulator
MDQKDKDIITLLRKNGRESTTMLARRLGLSRSTVQDRITRLEEKNIIAGYTIRFNEEFIRRQITAHVMIVQKAKYADSILIHLKKISQIRSIYTVSGIYDLIVIIKAETTEEIDQTLDNIGKIEGVEKTTSSIVLSTKYEN